MSTLSSNARFARQPSMVGSIPRSRFDRSFDLKTTFNAGSLVPIFSDTLLPGDTVTLDVKSLVRMATPVTPTMDNAYLSVHFFAVPLRLVWEDFKYFMGENKESAWAPATYPVPPKVAINVGESLDDTSKVYIGSVADYFGVPVTKSSQLRDNFYADFIPSDNVDTVYLNVWKFRAYTLIWNTWFRSNAIMDPAYCPLDSNNRAYSMDPDPLVSAHLGGALLPVCKFFDYFTGALPDAQRGEPIGIPVSSNPWMPVASRNENALDQVINGGYSTYNNLRWYGDSGLPSDINFNISAYGDEDGKYADTMPGETGGDYQYGFLTPANLFALGTTGAMGTINDLRLAFQLQRMLEKDARGGGLYINLVLTHFGVRSSDARQQLPEYLGGFRTRVGMQSVAQTSSTDSTSPQGNLAAYSLTTDFNKVLTFSSTEHCLLIGVADVRTEHTYGFGLDRDWFIDDRYDVYWPALANIGELPIINREICMYGSDRNEYFGYQEAWADYRYKKNELSGYMRSQLKETLSYWHYGDDYSSTPRLSPSWLAETPKNIDRTLAVSSDVAHQFIANFQFIYYHTREMPMFSIPGLIDHN